MVFSYFDMSYSFLWHEGPSPHCFKILSISEQVLFCIMVNWMTHCLNHRWQFKCDRKVTLNLLTLMFSSNNLATHFFKTITTKVLDFQSLIFITLSILPTFSQYYHLILSMYTLLPSNK